MKKDLILASALAVTLAAASATAGFAVARAFPAHQMAAIVPDFGDTVALLSFTNFDGRYLSGSFTGDQPRFLLGAGKEVVVPAADGSFRLDLKLVK